MIRAEVKGNIAEGEISGDVVLTFIEYASLTMHLVRFTKNNLAVLDESAVIEKVIYAAAFGIVEATTGVKEYPGKGTEKEIASCVEKIKDFIKKESKDEK